MSQADTEMSSWFLLVEPGALLPPKTIARVGSWEPTEPTPGVIVSMTDDRTEAERWRLDLAAGLHPFRNAVSRGGDRRPHMPPRPTAHHAGPVARPAPPLPD
jgi:hypothetical protein